MTKKTALTAVILLLVLALLIVGYMLLKNKNEQDAIDQEIEEQQSAVFVNTYDSENIKSLTYTNDGASLSFEKDANGSWNLTDDVNYPIDPSYVDNMANAVSGLRASRRIETEESPEFGFSDPVLTVDAVYSDGTKLSLAVGATNSFNGNVYLKDLVTSDMYLVESGFTSAFEHKKEDLMLIDTFPSIDNDNLVSMTVRDADGTEKKITEGDELTESAELFENMTFSSDNAFYADDAKLAECGITPSDSAYAELAYKSKVSVSNDDGSMSTVLADESYKLVFGNSHIVTTTDDDGNASEDTYYYYTTAGSHIVYSAKEATYTELMRFAKNETGESK